VLRTFLSDADLVSCELVFTKVPRAIRRAAARDPRLPLEVLIERAARRPADRYTGRLTQSTPPPPG